MSKVIMGFCGHISSGKGTICEYIKNKYNAETVMFSQSMRDILNRLYLDVSRANLQKISLVLREGFSQDIFAQVVSGDAAKSSANLVCVDGIRRPKDIEYLQKLPNFYLIKIEVDLNTRWQRLVNRSQNEGDATKSLEQFKAEEMAETEILIDEVGKNASFIIDNNGDFASLYKQIDEIYAKVK